MTKSMNRGCALLDAKLIEQLAIQSKYPKMAASSVRAEIGAREHLIVKQMLTHLQNQDHRAFRLVVTNKKSIPVSYRDIKVTDVNVEYPQTPAGLTPASAEIFIRESETPGYSPMISINIPPLETREFLVIVRMWRLPSRQAIMNLHSNSLVALASLKLQPNQMQQYAEQQGSVFESDYILYSVLENKYLSRGTLRALTLEFTDTQGGKCKVQSKIFNKSQNGNNVILNADM